MDAIEGHPIPQDITGFQFKLIGDMTVKQFAYLAIGLALGWIVMAIPGALIIKLPIALVPAFSGLFLAFIPIEGRPADTMLLLFFQSIFRPNEYVYHNPQQTTEVTTLKQKAVLPEEEKQQKHSFHLFGQPTTSHATIQDLSTQPQVATQPVSLPQAEEKKEIIEKTVTELSHELEGIKKDEHTTQGSFQETSLHQKSVELETKLQQAILEKEALQKQLTALQQTRDEVKPQPVQPATTNKVKKVPDSLKKAINMPFAPDVPNLVTGIIHDARGNVLPNILVEVMDHDNNPVRAFKTNALGQFASATPLLNGDYIISFEDPKKQQKFDSLEITVDGNILNPLEIVSIDAREELRKSLFN